MVFFLSPLPWFIVSVWLSHHLPGCHFLEGIEEVLPLSPSYPTWHLALHIQICWITVMFSLKSSGGSWPLGDGSGTETLGVSMGTLNVVHLNLRKGGEDKPFASGHLWFLSFSCKWTPGSNPFRHGSVFLSLLGEVCFIDFVSHLWN